MSDIPDSDARQTFDQSDGAAVLRGLTDEELLDLLNRLMLFARRRYFGRLNVEELAMQAVTDTLSGQRTWNTAYPVFNNLCLILKSIAFNQLQKEKHFLPDEPEVEAIPSQSAPSLQSYPSPQEILETSETQSGLSGLLHKAAGDDELSRDVVELSLQREDWRPKEMAAVLDVPEKDIYNTRLRLRRRLGRLLNRS
jgi:DNA-directed RNA polymerase specialized sigma24 family protein